jgi:hypothetical protein
VSSGGGARGFDAHVPFAARLAPASELAVGWDVLPLSPTNGRPSSAAAT